MLLLLAAIVIGISLGLFGSGGSILTIPVLLYLLAMPAQLAIASSLFIVAMISLCGAIPHIWQRNVSWPHVVWFGLPGMLGTYGGAWLGTLVDSRWQLLVFALLMLGAAVMMWRSKTTTSCSGKPLKHLNVISEGLIVGIITGFVGVGGGFLIVPALVLLAGLSLTTSIATSLVIITLKSFAGFIKYFSVFTAQGLHFDWSAMSTIILAGIVGSYFGHWLSQYLPRKTLQRSFAAFLVLMALFVLSQSVL